MEWLGSPNLFSHGPLAVLRCKGVPCPVNVSFQNNPQLLMLNRHPAGLGSLHSLQVCPFGIPHTMFVVYAFGWNLGVNG